MIITGYLLFYLICFINIIWGILKKRSNVLYAVALVVIFVLMAFNCQGPDIEAYIATYKSIGEASNFSSASSSTYMEKGYTFIMFCANKLGLDFYAFRIVLTIICLTLFVSTIKYFKVNPNMIIGLYMLYVFFFDTIQIRNCIIQFIILFSMRYLFGKSSISLIKYIICIAVAGSIHVLSWLFLSLLLIRILKTHKAYKMIFAMATFLFIGCFMLQPVLPRIINAIAKLLNRGSGYLQGTISYGYWAVMALHMLGLIPLYLYKNKVSDEITKTKIMKIMHIEIIMGLFLPLTFINNNFNRIFRNILLLDMVGLTLLYENQKKKTESNDITISALILLDVGWLFTDLLRYEVKNIIGSVMEFNLIYMHIDMVDFWKYIFVIIISLAIILTLQKFIDYNRKQHRHKEKVTCN